MAKDNKKTPLKEQSAAVPDILSVQKTLESGKTIIGIDISASSVNVAQTALYNGKPTLIKVVVEDITLASEKDHDKAATEALKRALSKFNTKKAEIICVMPSLPMVIETVLMPVMPPDELADAIKLEVSSSQRFVIDNPILDFQVVGRVADKGVQKMNVLVAAAPKTAVDGLLANFISPQAGLGRATAPSLGLNIDAIIPLSIALENILKKSKLRKEETLAVVEMGTMATELNIYRNFDLEFSRKIPVTGNDLTRSLTSALFTSTGKLELNMQDAEAIKREFGIPAPGESYLIRDKITAAQVLSLLRPKLEQLASEISRSFDYYREKMNSGKVDRIVVFGGGSRLKGLAEYLNAELGLPVDLGSPLLDVDLLFDGVLPNRDDIQRLVQAIGASLGDVSGLNLLPAPLKDRKKRSRELSMIIGGAIVFLSILGFFYFGSMIRMNLARDRAAVASQKYQVLLPKLKGLKNGLLLKKMIRNRPDLGGFIKQLSYMPSYMYLTDLTFEGGRLYMAGFISGSDKNAKDAAGQLVAEFRKGIMADARVLPGEKTVPGKVTPLFEIEGRIGSGGGAQ